LIAGTAAPPVKESKHHGRSTTFAKGVAMKFTLLLLAALAADLGATCRAQEFAPGPLLTPPPPGDDTHQSLRAYQQQLLDHYGGYLDMPLDVKAAYFDWELWRYHLSDYDQVYHRVVFPDQPGQRPVPFPARDSATWNGAVLAALSFQYAVTHDSRVLDRIAHVVRGLHLFFAVTGKPGLMARAVARADALVLDELAPNRYVAPDGTEYRFQGNPAKGSFNQIACGYAALLMHAGADLPPEVRELARADMTAMVLHLIDHDYRATDADGQPTSWGDLRPRIGPVGVPFNAQVAYLVVALGYSFPPDDPASFERIREQFVDLRGKHHVYYENPWRSVILPQRIGGSRLVKGMNDRNHVTNAAYFGLALELDHSRRHGEPANAKFLHQLGQTMYHSMEYLHDQRNSLCTFMWAGLLQDAAVRAAIVPPRELERVRAELAAALVDAVEQLRHFRLDRFQYPGPHIEMDHLQWNDDFQPDDNYWKANPYVRKERTGPADNIAYCAMDYLYAYWLFRYYGLEAHPALAGLEMPVLARTPGLDRY
jgi:hypothetical protein